MITPNDLAILKSDDAVDLTSEQAALLWANMPPYRRMVIILFWLWAMPIVGIVYLLGFKQYHWDKKQQQLVPFDILGKVLIIILSPIIWFAISAQNSVLFNAVYQLIDAQITQAYK